MKTSRGKLSAQCGSPAYVAPEIILGQQYTPAVDMWAVGCILYCLLNGQLPFYDADEQAMFRRIAKGEAHPLAESVSEDARELIGQLLCTDKVTRLTASEALEHRWITGGSVGANGEDGAKPINRSRMERFAETHMDAGALETRELRTGDLLIKQGARAKEIFLIREGSCEVVVKKDDGSELKVAERHAGEFVGEMGVKLKPDGDYDVLPPSAASAPEKATRETESASPSRSPTKREAVVGKIVGLTTLLRVKNKWVGGRRGADVRATTPMKVVVMTADQMQWIREHDYGADGEMTKTIKKRAEELRRKSLDNGIVHA
jgi:protein serine kinase H